MCRPTVFHVLETGRRSFRGVLRRCPSSLHWPLRTYQPLLWALGRQPRAKRRNEPPPEHRCTHLQALAAKRVSRSSVSAPGCELRPRQQRAPRRRVGIVAPLLLRRCRASSALTALRRTRLGSSFVTSSRARLEDTASRKLVRPEAGRVAASSPCIATGCSWQAVTRHRRYLFVTQQPRNPSVATRVTPTCRCKAWGEVWVLEGWILFAPLPLVS